MLAKKYSKENLTVRSPHDEISSQIDRLNITIGEVMREVEFSSTSRIPSRLSTLNCDDYQEDLNISDSSICIESRYTQTIEALLLNQDRQQMIIEDYRSEEFRRPSQKSTQNTENTREVLFLNKKQELQIDEIREYFTAKESEVQDIIAKLKLKEELLSEKENELRKQRLNLEKLEMDLKLKKEVPKNEKKPEKSSHCRSHSFSFFTDNEQSERLLQDQLKTLQSELKYVETNLEDSKCSAREDREMRMESIKNKITRVRADIAMNKSNKGSVMVNNMLEVLQKETDREEKMKKAEIMLASRELSKRKPPLVPSKLNIIEYKTEEKERSCSQNFNLLNVNAGKNKKSNENSKETIDKKTLAWKEKDIHKKEEVLQRTWMRSPGVKEMAQDVSFTARLNGERTLIQREKDGYENEGFEWKKLRN